MTVAPVLLRSLRYGGILALSVAVVAGVIGLIVAGTSGLIGGLSGALLAAIFLGMTAASMLFAGWLTKGDSASPVFYGIVLGVWLLKLIVFVLVAIVLRGQLWLSPAVFFCTVIVTVVGSLATDIVAFQRTRMSYVSDIRLPGESQP